MNLSLERKIVLGFLTAVIAVLATGVAAWMNARRIDETFGWVEHTHQVRHDVESVLIETLNMQTALRGFMVTGEEPYLEPYHQAKIDLFTALSSLKTRIADNPQQRTDVEELTRRADHIRTSFDRVIEKRRTEGMAAARELGAASRNVAVVEEIRALIEKIDGAEQALLSSRSRDAKQAVNRAAVNVVIMVLLAAAALAIMMRFALNDYRRRVRAERELADFFRLSLDPLSVISTDGRFLRLNPAWRTVLGYPLDQMIGRPFMEFVHPDDVDRSQREAERVASGAESVAFQNRYRARNGEWRWLEWNAAAVPGSGQLIAVARDVTARKQDEAKIAEMNDHLQAQNTELEAFSYSVSHDLRAPLRHMTGFAQLLLSHAGPKLDDKSRHYITVISDAAQTMSRLIDNLLEFSRTARAPISPQPVDHARVVQEVIAAGKLGAETNVDWKIGPLPTVAGDAALLRQVWTNYLSNAVKYSAKSETRPTIHVNARHDEAAGEIVFSVQDNGVGFDPRYASRLFQVFTRLHDAQQFEGTGIGLALVRRIVSRHGGRTWAQGEIGKGATFYFTLPLTAAKASAVV